MRLSLSSVFTLAGLLIVLTSPGALGSELKTRYATVVYERDELVRRFNKEVTLGSLSYLMRGRQAITVEDEVRTKVDVLVERIESLLDMFPREMRFRIVLLPTAAEVRKTYKDRYRISVDFIAFYAPRDKTVFLSVDDIELGVLAHELTHVILDHYFGISPPAKIHEVLAQFVEAHLKD